MPLEPDTATAVTPAATPAAASAHRLPRTARGAATRQKLIDAAELLFGERGFHATGVSDVTRSAGVAQGTFYLYFDSKEAIFRELVRHLSHELRLALQQAGAGLEGRLEVEEAGLRGFIAFAARHRNLYRIVFESQFIDPELFRWYYERIAQGYARGLREAARRGEVRDGDAETLAYCLMGAAHFLGMRWVVWEHSEPPAKAVETLLGFVRAGLAPEPG
jgi:AcrR family transcriptional regulator